MLCIINVCNRAASKDRNALVTFEFKVFMANANSVQLIYYKEFIDVCQSFMQKLYTICIKFYTDIAHISKKDTDCFNSDIRYTRGPNRGQMLVTFKWLTAHIPSISYRNKFYFWKSGNKIWCELKRFVQYNSFPPISEQTFFYRKNNYINIRQFLIFQIVKKY